MLTPTMILAENQSPALTDEQVLNLQLLVKASSHYAIAQGLYAQFVTKLTAEQVTPTVATKALKAVLTQLDSLPAEVAESQGRTDSPGFFSVRENWNALALDVLNVFFDNVELFGLQTSGVVQRRIEDLTLNDDSSSTLRRSKVGRRF